MCVELFGSLSEQHQHGFGVPDPLELEELDGLELLLEGLSEEPSDDELSLEESDDELSDDSETELPLEFKSSDDED